MLEDSRVGQQNHVSSVVFQDRDLILVLFFFSCDWDEKRKNNNPKSGCLKSLPAESFDSSLSIMTGLCSVAERRWQWLPAGVRICLREEKRRQNGT